MSAITAEPRGAISAIPAVAGLLVILAITLLYLVAFEAGPVSAAMGQGAAFLHEAFHDGRHAIGVPCH